MDSKYYKSKAGGVLKLEQIGSNYILFEYDKGHWCHHSISSFAIPSWIVQHLTAITEEEAFLEML